MQGGVVGTCEPPGFCAFPDPECESELRYGSEAPADIAGACVPPPEGTDGTGSGDSTALTGGSTAPSSSTASTTNPSGDSTGTSTGPDPPPVCGNGEVEAGEACDDGNAQQGDGCNPDCVLSGEIIWSVVHDIAGEDDIPWAVDLIDQDVLVLTGKQREDGNDDILVQAYGTDGRHLWTTALDRSGPGEEGRGVAVGHGAIWVAGRIQVELNDPDNPFGNRSWLGRFDLDGNLEIEQTAESGHARDVAITEEGVVVVGVMGGSQTATAYARFFDLQAEISDTISSDPSSQANAVAVDGTSLAVAGLRGANINGDAQMVLEGVTPTEFTTLYTVTSPFGFSEGQAVVWEPSGDLYVGGWRQVDEINGSWSARDTWVGRIAPDGEVSWFDEYAGDDVTASDEVEALALAPNGDLVAVGFAVSLVGYDLWIRRFGPSGEVRWTRSYDLGGGRDTGRGVVIGDAGEIYVVAEAESATGDFDIWVGQLTP